MNRWTNKHCFLQIPTYQTLHLDLYVFDACKNYTFILERFHALVFLPSAENSYMWKEEQLQSKLQTDITRGSIANENNVLPNNTVLNRIQESTTLPKRAWQIIIFESLKMIFTEGTKRKQLSSCISIGPHAVKLCSVVASLFSKSTL